MVQVWTTIFGDQEARVRISLVEAELATLRSRVQELEAKSDLQALPRDEGTVLQNSLRQSGNMSLPTSGIGDSSRWRTVRNRACRGAACLAAVAVVILVTMYIGTHSIGLS